MLLPFAAALLSPQPAHDPPAYSEAQARRELQDVVAAFGEAIIQKDTARFLALFADGPVIWQGVDSDALLADGGQAGSKAAFDPAQTPRNFIEEIAQSPDRHEEVFRNIRVEHDRDIAAITFDFAYRVNGRSINEGKESWHLVRTAPGWRIVSVIYSNNDPVP